LKKFAKAEGIEFKQTKVGDRYVLEEMVKSGDNLGGEQSGHIIFLDYNPTGDGILTSLMVLKAIGNKKPSEVKKIVNIYPQVLINAKVSNEKKFDYDKDIEIKNAIEELEKEFSDNGRVLIRTSGTEPIVRVMIEGENQEYITKKAKDLANLIESKLGK
jgi:phosphoglucosamine mutase